MVWSGESRHPPASASPGLGLEPVHVPWIFTQVLGINFRSLCWHSRHSIDRAIKPGSSIRTLKRVFHAVLKNAYKLAFMAIKLSFTGWMVQFLWACWEPHFSVSLLSAFCFPHKRAQQFWPDKPGFVLNELQVRRTLVCLLIQKPEESWSSLCMVRTVSTPVTLFPWYTLVS